MPNVRIAAMSDLHVGKTGQGTLAPILSQLNDRADVLLLGGDLTDYGTAEEARVLVKELGALRVPVVAVLGNHDFESGHADDVAAILRDAGIVVLDGESHEVQGIGFAGVKGFAGGFGRGTLGAWGEGAVKAFVQEAVHETMKLESALARLRTRQKVALLHYAPIRETVEGEPLEIFPFLGCGRHEEPLLRYKVSAVFPRPRASRHLRGAAEQRGAVLERGPAAHARPAPRAAVPHHPLDSDGDHAPLPPPEPSENGVGYEGPERRRAATH
jgi:Icc-related predicted phosphoesterase